MDIQKQDNTQASSHLYVIFQVDDEEYAASTEDVMEIIELVDITAVPQTPEYVLGIINLRGQVIPVIDLEKKFGLVHEQPNSFKHILITKSETSLYGIRVNIVKDVMKIDESSVQQVPSTVSQKISNEYLKGAIVLSEDRIVLIVNLKKVLSNGEMAVVNTITLQTKEGGDSTNENPHRG